jgi:serine/threonine protein kinase
MRGCAPSATGDDAGPTMLGRLSLTPGRLFAGQFRVIQPIAAGGMGTVYRVEQVGTGQQRALKVMNGDLVDDPRARERFTREAQLAAMIESEHVAQVLAAGIDPEHDTPWMLLELLRGEDLSKLLERRGRLPPAEARELLKQLGHALSAAHRQGIVHRDLKPENIFVAEARRSDAAFTVKVLDFGIAKWLQENAPARTTSVMGSPLWMAPEQFDTARLVSPSTDIWALGLLAFTMLTGVPYWKAAQGPSITLAALLAEISMGQLVPASQRASEAGRDGLLPPGFDGWFARCVAREAQDRFADATQAHAALEAIFQAPVAHAPTLSVPPTMAIPAMPVPTPVGHGSTVAWTPQTAPPPNGTAMMPVMASGVPPWMVNGAPAPLRTQAPPRRSGGTAIALGVGALAFAAVAVAGVAWWTSQCDDGFHDSHGHCCRSDATWDEDRRACVASSTPAPATVASTLPTVDPAPPLPPTPPPTPTPTLTPIPPPAPVTQPATDPPSPVPPPRPEAHACLGAWTGRISENTGAYGSLRVTVRQGAIQCGEWREVWENSGSTCVYRFVGCRFEDGAVRGTGISTTPRCTARVSASVRCGGGRMAFRESTSNGVVDTATLRRAGD